MEVNVLLQSSDHLIRWFTCIPKGAGWLRGVEVGGSVQPFQVLPHQIEKKQTFIYGPGCFLS